jgi:hypothetical protein
MMFEITTLAKAGGPLTKHIALGPDGLIHSDGSACVMSAGSAQRATFADLGEFADHMAGLASHEAIALGALRHDLPDRVEIATKARLERLNGAAAPHLIARTAEHIHYWPDRPALVLIDIDTKGMPGPVRRKIREIGGFWDALLSVLPELNNAGTVFRQSTSAGLRRSDTGEHLPGSNGVHVYVLVTDGSDAERFLRRLHERCWLHGLGWLMVGAAGQLLDRSLVDRMVYAPERLVFEGPPVLDPPLMQDQAARAPDVSTGPPIDTQAACPDLSHVEHAKLRQLRAAEAHRLAPDADKARGRYIEQLAERTGCTADAARQMVERQCAGTLLPGVVLPFDAIELQCATVGDVLADPARFVGETLADPLEGISYGRCKALIMQRADGTLWVHSFAHGRTTYDLKHDAATIEAALRAGDPSEAANSFVRLLLAADLAPDEELRLRELVCELAGTKPRPLGAKIKAARQQQQRQHARAEHDRRAAERTDPRPLIPAPSPDAPWLPNMQILNDVLGTSTDSEPPARDIDGVVAQVNVRRMPNMHALTPLGSNQAETKETRLPAPEQPVLARLDETMLAELIERHIEYVDPAGQPVHLPGQFVRHFLKRPDDDALPIIAAIATLPIVLADGSLLATPGLHRQRGIVFRVPEALLSILPTRAQCDDAAVRAAFKFLTDDWLVDVATDFAGKCVLIAAALTLIERSLLPDRPVFFVTAGRRGGGKTTTLIMLLMAITGARPAAAAWSANEEERRKALLAYLLAALPCIIWDNIKRGSQLACPFIELSCTTTFYSDRRLGVSETIAVAAAAIHFFTGNNIGPRGDLASRALSARLEIDRADPENRPFTHPDPVGWTEANRGKILAALYTIALGNPALRSNIAPRTRFKIWWRLCGSAVEHAAQLCNNSLDFQTLFLSQEEDDEETASLADALQALATLWPNGKAFLAADLARLINDRSEFSIDKERATTLREFLFPELASKTDQPVTAKAVGKRLKRHIGEPLKSGTQTLCLKALPKAPGYPDAASSYAVIATG